MKSLSAKIGLGYGVIIGINVVIAALSMYYFNRLSSPISQLLKEKYQNVNAAEGMRQALYQQEFSLTAMLDDKSDTTLVNSFHTYKNEFYNWHQRAIEGIALPEEPLILDSISTLHSLYISRSVEFRKMLTAGSELRSAQQFKRQFIAPLANRIHSLCRRLKAVNEQAIAQADARAKRFSQRATIIIVSFVLLAITLSILASVYFTRYILKPVKETTATVRKIGKGQLNQKIHISTKKKNSELAREFNKMTQRLQAYEEMNINQILLEKRKSEAIVANIPFAIIVTDEQHRLSLLNEQAIRILQLADNEWVGKPVTEVVSDNSLIRLLSGEQPGSVGSTEAQMELVKIVVGNEERYYRSRRVIISDDEQHTIAVVTVLQDVTHFKTLDRLKTEFIATISHEFKTPLTSITMAVDILLREVRGKLNQHQRELLQDAKEDCQRLNKLVKDLLDLSRLESGRYPFSFQKVTIKELIEFALQPLNLRIRQQDIQFNIDIPPDIPPVTADLQHLSRVITNLVENAIQHTPAQGKISLRVKCEENYVKVCVADTGEGIPPESLPFIFDKFVQVKQFKDAEKGNIGLGLAIAREIVKAHQGKIWVESQLHMGSQFYFTIPLSLPANGILEKTDSNVQEEKQNNT